MADTDANAANAAVPETMPQETPTPASGSAPTQDNTSQSDVEALKAQLQKIEMERNLLRKKVDATSKELEAKTTKELEEKEDYRALAERATAQLDELLKEKQETETKQAREAATSEVFGNYDPKVVEVAKTAGLSATDDSDEAKEALKAKLEELTTKIGISSTPKVVGSNPSPQTTPVEPTVEYAPRMKHIGMDLVANRSAVAQNAVNANKHLKNLESIKAMKAMAGVEPQEV